MRIGLIVDPFGEKTPSGLGRSIYEMVKALLDIDKEDEFFVYVKRTLQSKPSFPVGNWKLLPLNLRNMFLSTGKGIDRKLDAYVFYTPIIPLFFFPKHSIVIAYDFAYLELPDRTLWQKIQARLLYLAHALSFWKAKHILTISETTRINLLEHFHVKKEKVTTVHIGFVPLGPGSKEMTVPQKFFLFAGVLKERKNVVGIVRGFAEFAKENNEYELLIAGKKSGEYYEQLLTLAKELGIDHRVRFLGYIEDAELKYLYSKADALVFPSFIEGFGMPVLEAMHDRLPVITSNQGSLAEIAGSAALLVDPKDVGAIAAAMKRISLEPQLREDLIKRGIVRANRFSWHSAAERLVEQLHDILKHHA